jgi:uncharacterized protein YbjT (DUF2867 family)
MIVTVTTPTGNVGSKVTSYLLNMKGLQVSLVARDRGKVELFEDLGALVHEGDLEDGEFVSRATATTDALFWVTPTPGETDNLRDFQNRLGTNAATAVVTNRIGRVVNLSSIGAHQGHGTGPIDGLHDVEQHLNEAGTTVNTRITHLRPAFFMENYLRLTGPIVEHGIVPLPIAGTREIPMVATDDIAVEAVRQLAFPVNGGGGTRPLHGPRDISFDEAAEIIGDVLGKPVRHVRTSPDEFREGLTSNGISDDVADRMVDLYEGMENGHVRSEHQRTDASATPTEFSMFCEAVLAPEIRRMTTA